MRSFAKLSPGRSRGFGSLCATLLFCLGSISRAHAGATLLLEEPYSYDGAFAGTGHVAVYLNHVCASSPVKLRVCGDGESGVVLSRYDGIAGYDWVAIPLIPYLYAVERRDAIPLFADARLVAFLRDQYRRDNLKLLAPDRPDGGMPEGNWYEMVGSSYDRTIYGFEIDTSPEQDALLVNKLNAGPNRERYQFMKRNCADFVREVINFYYPHALHRSVIGDLGVTTPKQIAKMLAKYGRHHPELHSAVFVVPQVPGAVRRSKPVHGVLESVVAAKKYMLPVVVLNPYIGGGLLVGYFGHHFDPSRKAVVLNARRQLDLPLSREERSTFQSRLNELVAEPAREGKEKGNEKSWEKMQAGAEPGLDAFGQPVLQVRVGDNWSSVGLTRANILTGSESSELAARLLEARLRQELRPSLVRKTARGDVEDDLALLGQLLSRPRTDLAATPSTQNNRVRGRASLQ